MTAKIFHVTDFDFLSAPNDIDVTDPTFESPHDVEINTIVTAKPTGVMMDKWSEPKHVWMSDGTKLEVEMIDDDGNAILKNGKGRILY